MSIYVARIIENKEIVAIFSAKGELDIFWKIDRICNPYECEYARAKRMFIGWPLPDAGAIDPDNEDDDAVFSGAVLDTGNIGQWKRFSRITMREAQYGAA